MTPWQVLRANAASRAALGYCVHHGAGASVHYSTAPAAAAAAADSGRSFCLSRERVTLQQLNRRLAAYLQQVQCLEAANQKLERQIQEELDRKCPGELLELDKHLRTASLLQDQISECHSAQAQVKLRLLNAELTVFDFSSRCEKERERRGCVEAELSDLRLLEEKLMVNTLPELQTLVNNQTQQLMELQTQHQQDIQRLLAQVSGGVTVEIQTTESAHLIHQLDDLRQTSVIKLDKNQDEDWFRTQVFTSPQVTLDPSERSKLDNLRRTAASLQEEMKQLQVLNEVLETSCLEQTEALVRQQEALQQTADSLCRDLDSALQAAAQQAADHEALLDVTSRLESEIQDYGRLLDGLSPQRSSSLHSNSAAHVSSAFSRNISVDDVVHGGSLMMNRVQTFPKGQISTIRQIPESTKTVQSIRVHSKHPKKVVTSINNLGLTGSFNKSDNETRGALHERTGNSTVHTEAHHPSSLTVSTQISEGSNNGDVVKAPKPEADTPQGIGMFVPDAPFVQVVPLCLESAEAVGDVGEVDAIHSDVSTCHKQRPGEGQDKVCDDSALMTDDKVEVVEGTTPVPGSDQRPDVSVNEPAEVTEDAHAVCSTVTDSSIHPDSQDVLEIKTVRSTAVQAKPETARHTDKEVGLTADKTVTSIQTETTKISLYAELEKNKEPHFVTHVTTIDLSKQPSAEVKEDAETVISFKIPCTEDIRDPVQIVSLSLETTTEALGDVGEVDIMGSDASESHMSAESQDKVCGDLALMDDKDTKGQEKKAIETAEAEGLSVLRSDHSSEAFVNEQNKIFEDADTVYSATTVLSILPDSNINRESYQSAEILKKVELEENRVRDTPDLDDEMVNLAGQETSNSCVGLSSSNLERPRETHSLMSPATLATCMSPETCLSPIETEVLLSMTDKVFYPVGLEQQVRSPDSLLSPSDPEMFLSPNDSDSCLSPVETKVCLSPNGEEEDEEVCLTLTEANPHVRPVEKYILSTKEEGQLLEFSGDQTLLKEEINEKGSTSGKDVDDLNFGDMGGAEKGRGILNGTNVKSNSTSQGIGPPLSSRSGGLGLGSPSGRSIIADKEEQLGFGGLYRKSVRDAGSSGAGHSVGKPSSSDGTIGDLAADFGGTASNSSSNVRANAEAAATAGTQGRFRHGGGDRVVYGGFVVHKSSMDGGNSLPSERKNGRATSPQETGRFGSRGSGEWIVYGGSLGRRSSLPRTRSDEHGKKEDPSVVVPLATSPPDTGRFGSRGSGEWRVYGGSTGHISSWAGSNSLPNADNDESPSVTVQLPTSPPGTPGAGRFGSGEWRVYGGSTERLNTASSADRVSTSRNQMISPPSSYKGSGPRLSRSSSGSRLSSSSVVRRSSSVGSGGRLSSSGSGGRLSSSSGSYRTSSSGRYTSAGSGEWRPVYSSTSARKSSVGSAPSGGGGMTNSQRALSPGGGVSVSMGGGVWLNTSAASGTRISNTGSGSKLSSAGSSDRISSQAGGRISNSSGSGRTNSTGGRVISSSDRPIRSTGSGAGGHKERISVCKMAALTISAAGRERSQDRLRQSQWSQQQQQQQAAVTSPLVQRWLSTGVGVTSIDPDGPDDIMHL